MNPVPVEVTLASGQFFRWRRTGPRFAIATHGRLFLVDDRLRPEGATADFVRRFFSSDHDSAGIERRLSREPVLREPIRRLRGLRILRQDPWECLVAFITSAASNIPRITRNLDDLCRRLGPELRVNGTPGNTTPSPSAVKDEALLRRLGFGFRARYLVDTAREVQRGMLRGIEKLPTAEARDRLCRLPGVGEKVADCVLLFAYERLESFPVDVRIRRVMIDRYFQGRRPRGGDRTLRRFAMDRFGPLAGYAQQYLYARARL